MTPDKIASMADLDSSVTTTIEAGPPKYQVVIPKQVRKALNFEDEQVLLEAEFRVKRVVDDGGDA